LDEAFAPVRARDELAEWLAIKPSALATCITGLGSGGIIRLGSLRCRLAPQGSGQPQVIPGGEQHGAVETRHPTRHASISQVQYFSTIVITSGSMRATSATAPALASILERRNLAASRCRPQKM